MRCGVGVQDGYYGFGGRNQQAYRYLREGVRVEYRANDEQKVEFARLIDFQTRK